MYETICYKKNYLTKVIVRIDFPAPIPDLKNKISPIFTKSVMEFFPVAEPRKSIRQELKITADELKQKRTEFTEWRFKGLKSEKTLTIIPNAIFIDYTSYNNFEQLKEEFLGVLKSFFLSYEDMVGSRLGLRYINNIELENNDPLSWEGYIKNQLLCLFKFYEEPECLARIFHNIGLNFDYFNLRYQFGMHNPDFPLTIRKKIFVLDFDAYSQSPHEFENISNHLDDFHYRIQELFEKSITENYRGLLNA